MYYIIETQYTGPNKDQAQYADADKIEISTTPAVANLSRETRLEGWCGTTNDLAVYAHGEYSTIEAARSAITEKFGDVRASGDSEENIVETYRPGKYMPMGDQDEWAYEGIQEDIHPDTTDDEIARLIEQYEAEANSLGYTLDKRRLEDLMTECRNERVGDLSP